MDASAFSGMFKALVYFVIVIVVVVAAASFGLGWLLSG